MILANACSMGEEREDNSPVECFTDAKVWRAGRQIQKPVFRCAERVGRRDLAVGGEVVEDDNRAGIELRHQHFSDVGRESVPVHRHHE